MKPAQKQISHEDLKALVSYNPDTGLFTRLKDGKVWGPGRDGRVVIGAGGEMFLAHRLAWFYVTGSWPKEQIDHINRDRSDNRWSNLREATQLENQQNKVAYSSNTSGHKGIRFDPRWSGRYCADICLNGVKHRARFKTLDEAIEWRTQKEQDLHPYRPRFPAK